MYIDYIGLVNKHDEESSTDPYDLENSKMQHFGQVIENYSLFEQNFFQKKILDGRGDDCTTKHRNKVNRNIWSRSTSLHHRSQSYDVVIDLQWMSVTPYIPCACAF